MGYGKNAHTHHERHEELRVVGPIRAKALAEILPHVKQVTLEREGHDMSPETLAATLIEFFAPES